MSLWEHLAELRRRLIVSASAFVLAAAACFWQVDLLFGLLTAPLSGRRLVFLTPTEGILTYFKVSLYAALFLASPVWLYQLWAFVAPALRRRERKVVVGLSAASVTLFCAGVAACWLLLPPMLEILLSAAGQLTPLLTASSYLSFLLWFALAFGIVFQMPVVIVFLVRAGIVSTAALWRGQRYAIVGAFLAGAVVTPTPDVVNQLFFAGPVLLLYEISLVAAYVARPRGSSDKREITPPTT